MDHLKLKHKICCNVMCKARFMQIKPLQKACCYQCAAAWAKDKRVAKELKEKRAALLGIKTRAAWLADAQAIVNKYVRLRDELAGRGCVSCDKPSTWSGQWHAGHYMSVGSSPALRFNADLNIWRQCSQCNNYLSGNPRHYRVRLIGLIGLDKVEWLESKQTPKKYTIDGLKELIEEYKGKIKALKNPLKGAGLLVDEIENTDRK